MHIGMIGGIGVAATDLYYRGLEAEMHRRGAPLDLTIVHADAATLLKHFLAKDDDAQVEIYVRLTERLKAAGAGCVAVTSIGGHFCIDAFKPVSPLPVIDIRPTIAERLARDGMRKIGILGTNTAMRTGLYGHLSKLEVIAPPEDQIETVHQDYVDMALSGAVTDAQRALFCETGRQMVADGAEAVLLGGTDLFLAFDGQDPGFPVVDGALIHVKALVNLAAGAH